MAATDPSLPSSENAAESARWQEDQQQGVGAGEAPVWTLPDSDPLEKTPAGAADAKTNSQTCTQALMSVGQS